eukprot:CAMPEP_0179104672 /NCGR_PEP_ID=MMETSP0796-20121207/48570_1 /TAXON_ID=73915 /ORGANISM="Pyrodinium bahamense, Strain pbaha01" /LENGTH=395 /DNA_ID=CAMNT_0020802629 /DNA_START=26 /DNA_END=1213 /DNA_ORIENTATION=+
MTALMHPKWGSPERSDGEKPLVMVPTPLRKRGSRAKQPRTPPGPWTPPARAPAPAPGDDDGSTLSPPAAGECLRGPQVAEEPLQRGDVVIVHRNFMSNSLVKVKVQKGWKGIVIRLDTVGDALVSFGDQAKLLWVAKRHFAHLQREPATDESPGRWCAGEVPFEAAQDPELGPVAHGAVGLSGPADDREGFRGFPVWLHVYDLGQVSRLVLNSWAAQAGGPGGAFHCGVEVLGVEFSFQAIAWADPEDNISGVTWHVPKSHPRHVYRESVWLGLTPLCVGEISLVLERLERTWLAKDYHCLRNNCTDFAEELALDLCVPLPFPTWAHGVAKWPLLAAAGGCCAPLVARAPVAQTLCCSSLGTAGNAPWHSGRQPVGHPRLAGDMDEADDVGICTF